MSTQDEDGYFGIYGPAMRFQHTGSNGELWAKTTVLRMMLGYYEMTNDENVLTFVEKTMDNTMGHYNKDIKSPFRVGLEFGGVTHGLMMTDVCETLYRITKKEIYLDYAVFLYEDFSEHPINRAFNDACYGYLMEKVSLFQSHSAHTYEHLRSVVMAYYATGYPEMEEAYGSALNKLSNCILPSGAGFGNEWLNKEMAQPDRTGAEVCGMNELKDFFLSALQKTGDPQFGDAAEKITFNALMGARNADGSGITYCKTDNCYLLNRKSPQSNFEEEDPRYKYSPTHADAAVCCNPNYARYFPYYVSSMWMKAPDGFAAVLYGPSTLTTSIKGSDLTIQQMTQYPFSDSIHLEMTLSNPQSFALYFRKPKWATSMEIKGSKVEAVEEAGYYKIEKEWKSRESLSIQFAHKIEAKKYHNGEYYVQRGPLVFAYKVPHTTENVKDYPVAGFHDYYCFPKEDSHQDLSMAKGSIDGFSFFSQKSTTDPWEGESTYIQGHLLGSAHKGQPVRLFPMGNTVLRRVTFP